jgi:hypothetical protein
MSASYTWPATVPQKPLFGSFSEDFGKNLLVTQMDAGVTKMRVRGNKPSVMNMTFMMSDAQVGYLETFINSEIKGVARFYFDHPRTENQIEVRIVPSNGSFYSLSMATNGYWNVAITFEVMP